MNLFGVHLGGEHVLEIYIFKNKTHQLIPNNKAFKIVSWGKEEKRINFSRRRASL